MKIKNIVYLLLFILSSVVMAQSPPTTTYKWRNYANPRQTNQIEYNNNYIYALTTRGVFVQKAPFSTQDEGVMYTRVEGLSAIDYTCMGIHPGVGVVLGSKEGYIDIIKDNVVSQHILDIYRSNYPNKAITAYIANDNLGYIGTSFGMVVYNFERQEVKETYTKFGSFDANIAVNAITIADNQIFVATNSGIAYASLSSPNLLNPSAWTNYTPSSGLNKGAFTQLVTLRDSLYTFRNDSLFCKPKNKNTWVMFDTIDSPSRIRSVNDELVIIYTGGARTVSRFNGVRRKADIDIVNNATSRIGDVTFDGIDYWFGDVYSGIYICKDGKHSFPIYQNAPFSDARNLKWHQGTLWVGSGGYTATGILLYNRDGVYRYDGKKWSSINYNNYPILGNTADLYKIYANKNSSSVYICAYGGFTDDSGGLFEYKDGNLSYYERPQSIGRRVTGVTEDIYGNVWVTAYAVDINDKPTLNTAEIAVKNSDGQWFNLKNLANNNDNLFGIMSDVNGYKWITLRSDNTYGILVYDDKGTLSNFSDDRFRYLGVDQGLVSNDVNAVVEDINGEIWVGTSKGISVFYNASDIFNTSNKAQCPVNNQRCLLNSEVINCITVDGANRKWIGTNNGLWLFSSDGSQQVYYFNKENSPLYSNTIVDVTINEDTGEVYISTDIGIISFLGDSTQAEPDKMGELFVYPNPFKPAEHTYLSLQGTVRDAEIRIMDINGGLVKSTVAKGGTVIWDGTDKTGQLVNTGVYVILIADKTGKVRGITKFAYIRE